jgi:iron complex outermembrane receptor protein
MVRTIGTFVILSCAGLQAAGRLAVRVIDPQGLAIPGASVEVRGAAGGPAGEALRTDAAGLVEITAGEGALLRVSADGFETAVRAVPREPGAPLTVRLTPAAVLTSVEVVVAEPAAVETSTLATSLEIDRGGARTVLDAVEQLVPGVAVTRRGVMGYGISTNGTGSVAVRGIGGSPNTGVLIVVDGRPDVQGLMGHPLPDFYSLSNVESLTVTEGPASVLYGSNAMGGAIEITPERPKPGRQTRLTSSLGSFLTGQHRLSHGAAFERGFYSLHAGVDHTRGDRESSAYRGKDVSVGAGYDLTARWRTSVQGRFGHFHVEDPGPVTAPLAGSFARVGRGGGSLNFDNAYQRSWGYARFYSSHGRHIITDGFRSVDSTTGARALQSFAVNSRLTLDAGGEASRFGGRASNVRSLLNYGEHHISTAAGVSRLQYAATTRLRLNTGLRYEHNSVFGNIAVPEFGASFKAASGYTLGAAVGKGFRNPTIRELYLFPAPNPLLQPETMWNYQATFRAEPSRSFQSSVTAYYADLSNMIVTTGRYPNLALRNTGRTLNRGFEATARWKPVSRVQWTNSYAGLRSTNLAPYIPARRWNTSLDIAAGAAHVYLAASTSGKRWADTARTSKLGGYTTATLKLTAPAGKGRQLFVMVDNLFDKRYEVVTGYPMPGVNAAAGFTLEF